MSADARCAICEMYATGETVRADHLEQVRQQRIVVAVLNGATDAADETSAELDGCFDCANRLAFMSLGMFAEVFMKLFRGDADAAIKAIEQGLLEDLDGEEGGA